MFWFLSKIQKVVKSFLFTCKRRFDFRFTKIIQGWTDHYEAFSEEMHSTCCLLYKNWREVTHRAWDTFPPDMPISLKRNPTLRHYKSHDRLTGSIEIAKAVTNRWRFLKSQPISLGISSSRYEFQYSVFCLNLHDIWCMQRSSAREPWPILQVLTSCETFMLTSMTHSSTEYSVLLFRFFHGFVCVSAD